jgi:hypothetical protein
VDEVSTVQRGPYDDLVLIQSTTHSVVNRGGDWVVLQGVGVKKNYGKGLKAQISAIGYFSSLMMARAREER